MAAQVKARRYDATRRRALAAQRRSEVLDTALRLFMANGYAPTTVSAISTASGVSEETVYKRFGGKAGLVRELRIRALGGEGDEPAERRADRLRAAADPQATVRGWATLAAEVAPRVVPILLLVRDGAIVDPGLRPLVEELDADRRRRMRENAAALHAAGHLRPGVSLSEAADVLFSVSAPEMYELLVLRSGWTLAAYGRYVETTISAALLRSPD